MNSITIWSLLTRSLVLLPLALLGLASGLECTACWGINHLMFLPPIWWWVYSAVCLTVVTLLFAPLSEKPFERALTIVDVVLFGPRWWPRLALALIAMVVFWLLRAETHFLGDGYGWISVMGKEGYYHKWTEYGSILIVRFTQAMLGGNTTDTAERSFQLLSILAGGGYLLSMTTILRRFAASAKVRMTGFVMLALSGALLLFFGYVEFYPLLWLAGGIFFLCGLSALKGDYSIVIVTAVWVFAVAMHLQALYLAPGLAYVVHQRLRQGHPKLGAIWLGFVLLVFALAATAIIWAIQERPDISLAFLPLLEGRLAAPDYAVFSYKHLWDMANLTILVFPGILIFSGLISWRRCVDPAVAFVAWCAVGAVLFLLLIDPNLGMARDWDLMSMTILPIALLGLMLATRKAVRMSYKMIVSSGLVCLVLSASYVAVGVGETAAVDRVHVLLQRYPTRSRAGWANYIDYLRRRGDSDRLTEVVGGMNRNFPEYKDLQEVYQLLCRERTSDALPIASRLVSHYPNNADFLQALANVFVYLNRLDTAKALYRRATAIKPLAPMLNELGQLYIKQGNLNAAEETLRRAHGMDPSATSITEGLALSHIRQGEYANAAALADTLFLADPHSPGGHLVQMVIALNRGDQESAMWHFNEFLKFGRHRSDYETMREHYGYLRSR